MLRIVVIAVGFSWILSFVAATQETRSQPNTPDTAFVNVSESQKLIPGQSFNFQLRLNSTPSEGWGTIIYRFQNFKPNPPNDLPDSYQVSNKNKIKLNDDFAIYALSLTTTNNQLVSEGHTDLHDNQTIYNVSLPIIDTMSPGIWKLVEIKIGGRKSKKSLAISNFVTFEIINTIRSPLTVHIQTPKSVIAGHRFTFKILVDEYPNGIKPDCGIRFWGVLRPVIPNGNQNTYTDQFNLNGIVLEPQVHSYEMYGVLDDPELLSGPWQSVISVGSITRFKEPPQSRYEQEQQFDYCEQNLEQLHLIGDIRFPFDVKSAEVMMPSSATVIVNPSQIELLHGEADRLKAKVENLSRQLNSGNIASNQILLLKSVKEAMTDLDRTENDYKVIGKNGMELSYSKAIDIFFNDIRFDYDEALKVITKNSAQIRQTSHRPERVSMILNNSPLRLSPVSEAVLKSILRNANAYDILASSKTFYVNLKIYSEPEGATISYRRRGGIYQSLDHETEWTIENLERAYYFIMLQKPGYDDKEVHFDAIGTTETSINVPLKRKRGAR